MAVQVIDNFKYAGKKPNFERDQFATLAAMKAYPESSLDEGHVAYCVETGKAYRYKSSNTNDATTGKWKEDTGVTKLPGSIFNINSSTNLSTVLNAVFGTTNVATLTEMFKGVVIDSNGRVITAELNNSGSTCYFHYFHSGNAYKLMLKATADVAELDTFSGLSYVTLSVVNALNSTSTVAPLSAAQGKVLNDKITTLEGKVGATISVLPGNITTLNSSTNATAAKIAEVLGTVAITELVPLFAKGIVIDSVGTPITMTFNSSNSICYFHYFYNGIAYSLTLKASAGVNLDTFNGITNVALSVIDNLTSTSTVTPLSANQGRVLKEYVDASLIIQ